MDAQGGAFQDSDRGASQRCHALGMQVIGEDGETSFVIRSRSRGWSLMKHETAA